MANYVGPVVAGKFYPGTTEDLLDRIAKCYEGNHGPGKPPSVSKDKLSDSAGLILPHAGYPYSGPVAAHGYGWIAERGKPESIIIIGTNHSGFGPPASILVEGSWSTPLGEVEFDTELGRDILEGSDTLEENLASFSREHSIEVQLPFLQHLWGDDLSIVPICLKNHDEGVAGEVADTIATAAPSGALIISSTDFTHYESQEVAERQDSMAIETIMDLGLDEFYETVRKNSISICGYGTIAVLIKYALKNDLKPTNLKYATSGDVAGYGREVVGYCAIGFDK